MTNRFTNLINGSGTWVSDNTLGRNNLFRWKIDDIAVHISRQFKDKGAFRPVELNLSIDQLDKISEYVAQKYEVRLGNSVSKLGDGTEQEGLGRFMHEKLNLTITESQASSQLAALFVRAGIWQLTKKRGMTFKANVTDWQEKLRDYYNRGLNGVIV